VEIGYGSRYADKFGKEPPRIPAVKTFANFRAFSQAGRGLAHWHVEDETMSSDDLTVLSGALREHLK
jgi:predicted helicase